MYAGMHNFVGFPKYAAFVYRRGFIFHVRRGPLFFIFFSPAIIVVAFLPTAHHFPSAIAFLCASVLPLPITGIAFRYTYLEGVLVYSPGYLLRSLEKSALLYERDHATRLYERDHATRLSLTGIYAP